MEQEIRINIELKDPSGKQVMGSIIIRDGVALSTFSDNTLAKKLYNPKDKNMKLNEEHNVLVQKYPHKSKDEILKIIKQELAVAGGKVK